MPDIEHAAVWADRQDRWTSLGRHVALRRVLASLAIHCKARYLVFVLQADIQAIGHCGLLGASRSGSVTRRVVGSALPSGRAPAGSRLSRPEAGGRSFA